MTSQSIPCWPYKRSAASSARGTISARASMVASRPGCTIVAGPSLTHKRPQCGLANAWSARREDSVESLPCRLARDAQRRPDLRPTYFPRSWDFNDLLELIALALEGILDWLKALQISALSIPPLW